MNKNINNRNNVSEEENNQTGSIYRATKILISLSNGTHSLTDIAEQCNLGKSTVHRVLKLLEQSQLVVYDPIERRYFIGPLVAKLSSNPETTHSYLIMCAIQEMNRLSQISEETVTLDIMVGIQSFHLYEVPSKYDLKVTQESKRIGPPYTLLYAGASAKVLLSLLDDKVLKVVLNNLQIDPLTDNTITDRDQLLEQIQEVRQQGIAVSYGEKMPGVLAISVPLKNYPVPAALSVVGPEYRLKPGLETVSREIRISSLRVSEKIKNLFSNQENCV